MPVRTTASWPGSAVAVISADGALEGGFLVFLYLVFTPVLGLHTYFVPGLHTSGAEGCASLAHGG